MVLFPPKQSSVIIEVLGGMYLPNAAMPTTSVEPFCALTHFVTRCGIVMTPDILLRLADIEHVEAVAAAAYRDAAGVARAVVSVTGAPGVGDR